MFDLKTYLTENQIVIHEGDVNGQLIATAKQVVRMLRDARRGATELLAALKDSGRGYGGIGTLVNNLQVAEKSAKESADALQQNLKTNPIK